MDDRNHRGYVRFAPWVFAALVGPSVLFRRATAARRALPSVFIIGAAKAGSTSLANYLGQSPGYVRALTNELMFLQAIPGYTSKYEANPVLRRLWGRYEHGLDAYRKFFPLQSTLDRAASRFGNAVTGDHTPLYLYCSVAPRRLRELAPAARLIVLLRNPVDRAFSDYNMFRELTLRETRRFEQAIDDEREGRVPDFNRCYLAQGLYERCLATWFEHFPRDQFLIVDSKEMFADPAASLARVQAFAGLPVRGLERYEVNNKGHYRGRLSPETRERLASWFRPHNERLYELLGRDFGWD